MTIESYPPNIRRQLAELVKLRADLDIAVMDIAESETVSEQVVWQWADALVRFLARAELERLKARAND